MIGQTPDPDNTALKLDAGSGWLYPVREVPSPNCDNRPAGAPIDVLVIHAISLPPGEFGGHGIDRLFTNTLEPDEHPYYREIAGLRVSSHVLIDRAGRVTQYVSFRDRAWHAGASCFAGREACNDFSIGIELEGADDVPYSENQYSVLADMTRLLQYHYPDITDDHIVGHCDIAPGRKTDPGPAFDWTYYRCLLEDRVAYKEFKGS